MIDPTTLNMPIENQAFDLHRLGLLLERPLLENKLERGDCLDEMRCVSWPFGYMVGDRPARVLRG